MAITGTGTGTSENPYIVSTWEEFLSVATSTSVYIKCADNCVWDFNRIAPEGIQDIDISFADWDGNGVELRNMSLISTLPTVKHFGLRLNGNEMALFEMKNVNFINFYINNNYQSQSWDVAFIILNGRLHIKNCKFSGYVMKGEIFSTNSTTSSSATNEPIFMSCSFNFNCRNNATLYISGHSSRKINFNNCKFVFDGEGATSSGFCSGVNYNSAKPVFSNSKISGKIPFAKWYFNADTTVFDAYTNNTINISFSTSNQISDTLINSTKYGNSTTIPTTFKQVTDVQMTDISYLQSIGFPVIEV